MPRAYSDDLRCKLLEAYEAGRGSWRELATQFRVSWGFSKKIRAQQLRSGQKERPKQSQHGPVSRLRQVERPLRAALGQQPDLTLAELQQRIAETTGVAVSRSRLWVWLRGLGLRHKKNRCARKNKKAARTSGGGRRGGNW